MSSAVVSGLTKKNRLYQFISAEKDCENSLLAVVVSAVQVHVIINAIQLFALMKTGKKKKTLHKNNPCHRVADTSDQMLVTRMYCRSLYAFSWTNCAGTRWISPCRFICFKNVLRFCVWLHHVLGLSE